MLSESDLEHGISQNPEVQHQGVSIVQSKSDKVNTAVSHQTSTTVFDFGPNGSRMIHERQPGSNGAIHKPEQAAGETLTPRPCFRVLLRKRNGRDSENWLLYKESEPASDTDETTPLNEADLVKNMRTFMGRMLFGKTRQIPSNSSFGIWELLGLWANRGKSVFRVDDPMIETAQLDITLLEDEFWLLQKSHILYLTNYGSVFTVLSAAMRTEFLSENHYQVECRFLTRQKQSNHSPLSTEFQNLLESEGSSMSLFDGNLQLGVKLVTLDMLRATIECWSRFFMSIRDISTVLDIKLDRYQLEHDIQHVMYFARSTRNIVEATEATLKAIKDFHITTSHEQNRYYEIAYEVNWKLSAMKNVVKDLESHYEYLMRSQESARNIAQESSLKRLTVLASVFLPTSLASSILSMNIRASNLGNLWYDFFGIFIVLGFIMFVVYQAFRTIGKIWVDEETNRNMHQIWNLVGRYVMLRDREKVQERQRQRQQKVAKGQISVAEAEREFQEDEKKREHQEKKQNKVLLLLRVAKSTALSAFYILWIVATASFLVGMFKEISTGLHVLGYGVAGTLVCTMIFIFPYRLVSMLHESKHDGIEAFELGFSKFS